MLAMKLGAVLVPLEHLQRHLSGIIMGFYISGAANLRSSCSKRMNAPRPCA